MFELSVSDFPDFFAEVNDHKPYQWQRDLMEQVHQEHAWPDLIDLPTGSGKTAVLEIAVFALALDAQLPANRRWAPRRIVLVVDRRIIVDQVHIQGQKILKSLTNGGDLTSAVRENLMSCSADLPGVKADPLVVSAMRGGMVSDEHWAARPDTPALISSTVDQFGSRALFRGYGISAGMRPIHAGLLTNDTLVFLDEVHLSRPFAMTLERIRHLQTEERRAATRALQIVELSATPGPSAERVQFPAMPLTSETADPGLAARLRARKPVELRATTTKHASDPAKSSRTFAKDVAKIAESRIFHDDVQRVGIIVNRVDTARAIFELLNERKTSAASNFSCTLVTGRMRPIDRDAIALERWKGPRAANNAQTTDVLVSTQCIEAGADLDFDVIITECASLDALKQRFGRVDRAGEFHAKYLHELDGNTEQTSRPSSVIVVRGKGASKVPPDDDAVYGSALAATWQWLNKSEIADFGIEQIPSGAPENTVKPADKAPFLTREHMNSFVQTWPIPATEHIASRWLHGDAPSNADVSIVWRTDICETCIQESGVEPDDSIAAITKTLLQARPVGIETLQVPIWSFRYWAGSGRYVAESDTDANSVDEASEVGREQDNVQKFIRWRSPNAEIVTANQVRPGDVIVVPSTRGGLTAGTWDPDNAETPVEDVSTAALFTARGIASVRLDPKTLPHELLVKLGLPPMPSESDTKGTPTKMLLDYIKRMSAILAQGPVSDRDEFSSAVAVLAAAKPGEVRVDTITLAGHEHKYMMPPGDDIDREIRADEVVVSYPAWFSVTLKRRITSDRRSHAFVPLEVDDAEDSESTSGGAPLLPDHLRDVGGTACLLATSVGLPQDFIDDFELAGRLHDLGKADPRFQTFLRLMSDIEIESSDLIARSNGTYSVARHRDSQEKSGYPRGARHELQSIAMMSANQQWRASAHDPDLVAFLVATHHGYSRPLPPVSLDTEKIDVIYREGDTIYNSTNRHELHRLDGGVPDLFWSVIQKYGCFQTAWFEAIFRLADHVQSALESARQEHSNDSH